MHLPIAVTALLCQLVPGLGLGEKLGHRALAQTQHILGEQSLADVVDREQLSDPEHIFADY